MIRKNVGSKKKETDQNRKWRGGGRGWLGRGDLEVIKSSRSSLRWSRDFEKGVL